MVCPNCGSVIPEGYVYCPVCGTEAKAVSDTDLLEEDFLREMIEEDSNKGKQNLLNKKQLQRRKRIQKLKKLEQERKKRRRRITAVVVILAAAACLSGFSYIQYRNNHSVEYLMGKARASYQEKDYLTARSSLEKLLELDGDQIEALLLAGDIDTIMKDYAEAETLLLHVLDLDPQNTDAYSALIHLYDAQNDRDKIYALMDRTHNSDILALFEEYTVPAPAIGVPGGSYAEYLSIDLSAPDRSLEIYYTLDGTDPTTDSTRYTEPVALEEEGTYQLKAVCADEEHYLSDIVTEKYTIELIAPDMPKVSPDGGEFSESVKITVTVPEGTRVYYTWNGSVPDSDSREYKEPLTIPEGNNVLSLIAIDSFGMKSEVQRCNYIYYPSVSESAGESEYENSEAIQETVNEEIGSTILGDSF